MGFSLHFSNEKHCWHCEVQRELGEGLEEPTVIAGVREGAEEFESHGEV